MVNRHPLKFFRVRDDKHRMRVLVNKRSCLETDGQGFTLPEVMMVIVIMGILAAIAIPSWRSVVEGRQVDSATNQLASDLRLAHTKATNRLTNYQVVFTDGSSSYQFGPAGSPVTRTLPDGVIADTTLTTIEFKPDGSVTGPAGSANDIRVSKTNPAADPRHGISVNPTTSRIKVD